MNKLIIFIGNKAYTHSFESFKIAYRTYKKLVENNPTGTYELERTDALKEAYSRCEWPYEEEHRTVSIIH